MFVMNVSYTQTVLSDINYVHGLLIKNDDLVDALPAPSLALQWSPDGLAFYDLPLQVNSPTVSNGLSHTYHFDESTFHFISFFYEILVSKQNICLSNLYQYINVFFVSVRISPVFFNCKYQVHLLILYQYKVFCCSCISTKIFRFSFIIIYYSKFDKHNCIDFHLVQCNEPTTLALGNFLCFSLISTTFAVVTAIALSYRF